MTTKSKVSDKTLSELEKITGEKLTLGSLLRSLRESDEKSQVDYAHILGVSRQQYHDIEHDRKSISPKLAADYADLLGYSREQFIRLALQGVVDRAGLNVTVEITKQVFGYIKTAAKRTKKIENTVLSARNREKHAHAK